MSTQTEAPTVGVAVFSRNMNMNRIPFINENEALLFDKIVEFKKSHPQIDDAYKKFITNRQDMMPKTDAYIKVVYSFPYCDMIIKYSVKKDNESKKALREKFEKEALIAGLVLDIEPAIEDAEFFMKVYSPFLRLCVEAQESKMKFALNFEKEKNLNSHENEHELLDVLWGHNDTKEASMCFNLDELSNFKGGDEKQTPFNIIVRTFFSSSNRILLTKNILTAIKVQGEKSKQVKLVTFSKLFSDKPFSEYFPLHDGPLEISEHVEADVVIRYRLYRNWALCWWKAQPLNDIREYFGGNKAFNWRKSSPLFCLDWIL